jgi:hypothetical protein
VDDSDCAHARTRTRATGEEVETGVGIGSACGKSASNRTGRALPRTIRVRAPEFNGAAGSRRARNSRFTGPKSAQKDRYRSCSTEGKNRREKRVVRTLQSQSLSAVARSREPICWTSRWPTSFRSIASPCTGTGWKCTRRLQKGASPTPHHKGSEGEQAALSAPIMRGTLSQYPGTCDPCARARRCRRRAAPKRARHAGAAGATWAHVGLDQEAQNQRICLFTSPWRGEVSGGRGSATWRSDEKKKSLGKRLISRRVSSSSL